ncbi:MAG: cytochrome c [Phycisphaerales bacterium]|nr:cytochrome c [Planctomycetota bacterium]
MKKTFNNSALRTAGAALCIGAGLLAGCRGDRSDKPPHQFFPDLDDQPRWKPQAETPFYANKRTMREPPANVVAFGRVGISGDETWGKPWAEQRVDLLRDGEAVFKGTTGVNADGSPKYVDKIPASIEITPDFIKLGQTKFNIYCSVCHGFDGSGKGMVGQQWSYPLPNFYDPKYKDQTQYTGKDGYVFNVIRNGVYTNGEQKMPGYGHALSEKQAWAVVAYFRALQESRAVPLSEVPDAERPVLEEKIRQSPPAAGSAAPAAPASNPADAPKGGGK